MLLGRKHGSPLMCFRYQENAARDVPSSLSLCCATKQRDGRKSDVPMGLPTHLGHGYKHLFVACNTLKGNVSVHVTTWQPVVQYVVFSFLPTPTSTIRVISRPVSLSAAPV